MSGSPSSPVKEGDLLAGKYRVERVLGVGGMGVVVAARHEQLDQRVAIKFVRDDALDNEDAVARFLREARAAVKLRSEHAAKVLDVGTLDSGAPYMVMEFLDGSDLAAVLGDQGPLPVEDVAEYIAQACEAVAEAHAAGIVHRDIKPQNLFLTTTVGGGARVKVLDFGVSKTLQSAGTGGGLTQTRSMLGSPLYMSPEQMRSSRDVDARSDVWAFGVVLFQLLTNEWPFQAETMPELVLKVVTEPPRSLAALRPEVPPEMVEIVERCLRKDPAERYANASELGLALEPLAPAHSRITIERARVAVRSTARSSARGSGALSGNTPAREAPTPAAWDSGKATPPAAKSDFVPTSKSAGMDAASARSAPVASAPVVSGPVVSVPIASAPVASAPADAPSSKTASTAKAEGDAPAPPAAAKEPVGTTTKVVAQAPPKATKRSPAVWLAGGALVVAAFGVWQVSRSHEGPAPAASAMTAPSASASADPAASAEIDEGRTESFGPLPAVVSTPSNPLSDEKIALGRMLYYEPRLSKNHENSCNTCHLLDHYGVDNKTVSTGQAQQQGTRNSPSVYNSAGYFALMWDGKFPNVEEQAKGPLTNPKEMDTTPKRVEQTLRSIPEYVAAFAKAFPGEKQPLTYDNTTKAIGAFERKLFTPSRWERYLAGEKSALTGPEKAGFNTFVETGCPTCHFGPYVGATMYQKLGLMKPWPTTRDRGRFELTQKNEDYMVFRVASLRNVAKTGPYLHDGSLTSLNEVVKMMARHQIGKELTDAQVTSIVTWLNVLTGELPKDYIAKPELPPDGPNTPAADPSP
ncbi:MAG TPA: cytochrome c peroxidase [Polyangiaceae bacterium]